MLRWDIADMRRLIETRYGQGQLKLAQPSLRAVDHRLCHARYRFQEAKALLKTQIDDRLGKDDIYSLLFPIGIEEQNALDGSLMRVEAHMIACTQSIHSIADILAHVVHFALGINLSPNPPSERRVNLRTVIAYCSAHAPAYPEVGSSLEALVSNSSFGMLDAIVNHTKHRGAVEPRLHIEPPTLVAPYAMEFGTFAYAGITHPEREME